MARPIMLVVAGPPGSGKSTAVPITALGVDAFNIDDRCAQLVGSYRAIPRAVRDAVAAECRVFVEQHIAARLSFAVETTLRTSAAIQQAAMARAAGFFTEIRFLATDSVELNITRVKQRAQAGGHGASESEVRATYEASIANLSEAIRVFERCALLDTSTAWSPPRLVAEIHDRAVTVHGELPAWVTAVLRPVH